MNILKRAKNHISWVVPSSSKNPDRQLASVWIRALQMIPYLENKGFACSLNKSFPGSLAAIFLRRYREEDIRLATKLKNKGTKIILDVVVNYFEVSQPHPAGYGGCSKEQHYNFMKLVEIADEIWCVSPFLKTIAERFHENVVFISDSIDKKHFSLRKDFRRRGTKPLRLGWSGVSVKAEPLNILKSLINEGSVSLCIISDKPPVLDFSYEFRRWKYDTFPNDIVDCDLCVAPRDVNNEYDRGHSIFKIGVFMIEGVPVLAGPVPSYELLLRDGRGGHICRSLQEWHESIRQCLINENKLIEWSTEAIAQSELFSTDVISKQIIERLELLRKR